MFARPIFRASASLTPHATFRPLALTPPFSARYFSMTRSAAAQRPPPDIRRVTSLQSPDYEPACEALIVSFGGDHISEAINGDNKALEAARFRASVATSVLDLEAYVASSTPGGPVEAVMLVKPPGIEHGKSPNASGPHTKEAQELATDPELVAALQRLKDIFHDVEEAAFGPRCVTDTFYISHVGVVPEAQGKGLGSALIRYMVKRAHEHGVPATLLTMTEKNEKLYEHLGFKSGAYLEADIRGIATQWWAMKSDLPIPPPPKN